MPTDLSLITLYQRTFMSHALHPRSKNSTGTKTLCGPQSRSETFAENKIRLRLGGVLPLLPPHVPTVCKRTNVPLLLAAKLLRGEQNSCIIKFSSLTQNYGGNYETCIKSILSTQRPSSFPCLHYSRNVGVNL